MLQSAYRLIASKRLLVIFVMTISFFTLSFGLTPSVLAASSGKVPQPPSTALKASFSQGYTAQFGSQCAGKGWSYTVDRNGFNNEYTLSNGNTSCAYVNWYLSGTPTRSTCNYYVFVPGAYANATAVIPGLWNSSGKKFYGTSINEAKYTDVLVYIGTFTNINHVSISDNNGQTGTYIGLGTDGSLYVTC
jgi:hypothetical protein